MAHGLSLDTARALRQQRYPNEPFHFPPSAQPLGARVALRVEGGSSAPEAVFHDQRRNIDWRVNLRADGQTETGVPTWSADVLMPSEMTMIFYHFEYVDGTFLREHRHMDYRFVGGGVHPDYGTWVDKDFQIAVYNPATMPPQWTQGMIMYQIFPDRFADGDPTTNRLNNGVYGLRSLFKTWGEPPEHPPMGRDFYGGDLRGIIQKLDYIADLGVECIYFNPIFHAASNHRYEAIDFTKIDPMIGTDADFDELIEAAHARGIKIVLDGVFNHCSSDSVYFDIGGKYGGAYTSKDSPFYRWFIFDEHPTKYRGWEGLGFMPEFVECPEVEDFFLGENGVTAYWLKRGIDGWRLDVTPDNSDAFWQKFRKRVELTKPDAYTVSELWSDSSHYLLGDMFSATMNYRFTYSVWGFCATDQLTPSELDDRLHTLRADTPASSLHAQMNLLDSHDTRRALTVAGGDRRRLLQMAAFQFAYPGAPMVYYGTESGLEGASAEDGRRCMPWDALDGALIAYYKRLIAARKSSEALRHGDVETVLVDDAHRLYGFARRHTTSSAYALFNGGEEAAEMTLTLQPGSPTRFYNVVADREITAVDNALVVTVDARGAAVLITRG